MLIVVLLVLLARLAVSEEASELPVEKLEETGESHVERLGKLFNAVKDNETALVAELAVLNRTLLSLPFGQYKENVLCKAVDVQSLPITKILIDAGADFHAPCNMFGHSALVRAALRGNEAIFFYLLDKGVDILPLTLGEGDSLVHWTIHGNSTKILRTVIASGTDLNKVTSQGNSPLLLACFANFTEMASVLLEAGADTSAIATKEERTPLMFGIIKKTSIWEELVAKSSLETLNYQSAKDNQTALLLALKTCQLDIVRSLIERGVTITDQTTVVGESLLTLAFKCGADDLIDSFVQNHFDAFSNLTVNTPLLLLAIQSDNSRLIDEFFKLGVEARDRKSANTSAIVAASTGNLDLLKRILAVSPDLSYATNRADDTPLSWASWNGKHEVVAHLLKLNSSDSYVNLQNRRKFTPLMLASRNGHLAAVELLLSAGANLDTVTKLNSSSLHMSATYKHVEVVRALIAHNADQTLLNSKNLTARELGGDELAHLFQAPKTHPDDEL